jgi:pimeloyl-ACP methyl ester carboxylesterase
MASMGLEEAERFIDEIGREGETVKVPCRGSEAVWHRFGQGRPLVMLHGGHGSWLHWIRNIRELSRSRELWLPDMPGFGDSADVPVHDMETLTQVMPAMINRLFPDREIDLVGFSFGGLVSANIAACNPRVRKLALIGSAGHGGARRQTVGLANWRASRSEQELHDSMRANLAAHMLSGPAAVDGLALAAHLWSCQKVQFRSKGISSKWHLADAFPKVRAPVLMLWGEHDVTSTPEAVAPLLDDAQAGRQTRILSGAGHWAQFEIADAINRELLAWFGD